MSMKPGYANPKPATASWDFCPSPVGKGTVTVFLDGTGNKSRGIIVEGRFKKKDFLMRFFLLSARFGD